MTEDQIERIVELRFDRLDQEYTTTAMTRETYERKCREIDEWADRQYALASA